MPLVRYYEPYLSDVGVTGLIPNGAEQYHYHVEKNAWGRHTVIVVQNSYGQTVYKEDLSKDGISHIHGLTGFRSRSDFTLKFFPIVWPPAQQGSNRVRVLVETGLPLAAPFDR